MNCTQIERLMLLEDQPARAGRTPASLWRRAISGIRRRRIDRHAAQCAACRQWRNDYRAIQILAAETYPERMPSETVMVNIHREARIRAANPPRGTGRTVLLRRPVYGLATVMALCLVMIGAWWLKSPPDGGATANDHKLNTILLMLSDEAALVDASGVPLAVDAVDDNAALESLGQQILDLQGLDGSYTEAELSTPFASPQATDPLTRNTSASHAERYG